MQTDLLLEQLNMEIKQLRRREGQFERLGDSQACCAYCERDADGHLEKHHPIGQANSKEWWVWACLSCHPSLTDRQYDRPDVLLEEREKSDRERMSLVFFALADGIELRYKIGIEKEMIGTDPVELVHSLRAFGLAYLTGADNEINSWSFIALIFLFGFVWFSAQKSSPQSYSVRSISSPQRMDR